MMSQIILFRVSAHMYNMHGITHQFCNYGKSPLKGTILMVKNRKKAESTNIWKCGGIPLKSLYNKFVSSYLFGHLLHAII